MTSDLLRRVVPGQPVRHSAELWNALIDSARSVRERELSRPGGPIESGLDQQIVRVRNNSGAGVARSAVLAISDPIILPEDSLDQFHRATAFEGSTPTSSTPAGQWCVTLEPIPDGAIGRAVIGGIARVKVDAVASTEDFAEFKEDTTECLICDAEGTARILWLETTGEICWAVVRLGDGAPGGGGGGSLTATYIGYGSGSNTLTGNQRLTYDANILTTSALAGDSGPAIVNIIDQIASVSRYPILRMRCAYGGSSLLSPVDIPSGTASDISLVQHQARQGGNWVDAGIQECYLDTGNNYHLDITCGGYSGFGTIAMVTEPGSTPDSEIDLQFTTITLGDSGSSVALPSVPDGQLVGATSGFLAGVTVGSGLSLSGGTLSCTVSPGGSGTVTSIGYVAPAAGITISGTNPVTNTGTWTFALANDLAALEALTGTNTIYYRSGADTWSAVTVGTGLSFSGGSLTCTVSGVSDGDKGDITVSGSGATWTIDPNVVDNAKLRDSAALSVIGRSANSTGDPADIAAGSDGHVLRRSGTTLGFGTIATAGYADASVTPAKISNRSALSVFGRSANSSGVGADIAAGTDKHILFRDGTTLGFGNPFIDSIKAIGCIAAAGSTQSGILDGTLTALNLDTEFFDPKAMHSGSGSTFTVPTGMGGLWIATVEFVSNWTGPANYNAYAVLMVNGFNAGAVYVSSAQGFGCIFSRVLYLSAGDTFALGVIQLSGSTQTFDPTPSVNYARLSVAFLGTG